MRPDRSFQGLILTLQRYWADQGCVILQPYDMEMGAGTFHPATTLRALGPQALEGRLCAALAPAEGRPLRREPQPAAALLPVPGDPEAVAAGPAGALSRLARARSASTSRCTTSASSRTTGRARRSAPGASAGSAGATAWRCRQFTYFQQVAGFECAPVSGELTYGLERLAMYVQGVENVYDLNFNGRDGADKVTYGDVFLQAEQEYSRHNFEDADTEMLFRALRRRRGRVQGAARGRLERAAPTTSATSWRCRPTTSASRRATSSTCSTRAA